MGLINFIVGPFYGEFDKKPFTTTWPSKIGRKLALGGRIDHPDTINLRLIGSNALRANTGRFLKLQPLQKAAAHVLGRSN